MSKEPELSVLAKPQQKNTKIQEADCRKHEYRLALAGTDDKGEKITYVFFCVHCLSRTAITDQLTKQGEKDNG